MRAIRFSFQLTASQGGWQIDSREKARAIIFQLTASQGGWLDIATYRWNDWYFNSQPHKEADSCRGHITSRCRGFQLTASQGGWRLMHHLNWIQSFYFNSQPHKEADGKCMDEETQKTRNFNSQPHKEADRYRRSKKRSRVKISTHSLTRRLTLYWSGIQHYQFISTHSLTRRLTYSWIFSE